MTTAPHPDDLWTTLLKRGVSENIMRFCIDLYNLDENERPMYADDFVKFCVAVHHFGKQDQKLMDTLQSLDTNGDVDNVVIRFMETCKHFSSVFRFLGLNSSCQFLLNVEKNSCFAQALEFLGHQPRSRFLRGWMQYRDYDINRINNYVRSYLDWDFAKQTRRSKACRWRKIHPLDNMFSPQKMAFDVDVQKAVQVSEIIKHLLQKYAKGGVAPLKQTLTVIPESRELVP